MIILFQKLSTRYAKATVIVSVLLTICCLAFAFTTIQIDTNQDSLISKDQPYLKKHIQYLKDFGDWESIYIIVHNKDDSKPFEQTRAVEFAGALKQKLLNQRNLYDKINFQVESSYLYDRFLLLASDSEFEQFENLTLDNKDIIQRFLNIKNFQDYKSFLAHLLQKSQNTGTANLQNPSQQQVFEDLFKLPYKLKAQKRLAESNLLFLLNSEFPLGPKGYFWTPKRDALILQVLPQKNFEEMTVIEKPIQHLKDSLKQLERNYPDFKIGLTGRPVLQYDEARITGQDSEKAGLASFLLVACLYFLVFRRFKQPLFALVSLFIGLSFTMGFISLVTPTLNLLSIVFAAILIGLGVDYGVHILYAYIRNKSYTHEQNILQTQSQKISPIFLGAVTSALAFGTAWFTGFWGLQQLGLIASVGLILCCLSQLIVLPALLFLFDPGESKHKKQPLLLFNVAFPYKKLTLGCLALVTLGGLYFLPQVKFEKNILNLQNPDLQSIQYEKLLHEKWQIPTWFLVETFEDLQQLEAAQKQVTQLGSVLRTQSLLDLQVKHPQERARKLNALLTTIKQSSNSQKYNLEDTLNRLKNKAFQNGRLEDYSDIENLETLYQKSPSQEMQGRLLKVVFEFQYQLNQIFHPELTNNQIQDIPKSLSSQLVNSQNTYALLVFPKDQIWEAQAMQTFLDEVRSVLPNATGTPVTTYESYNLMINGFEKVALLTLLLVLIITVIQFKEIKRPLLIVFNLFLSFVWLLEIMGAFGLTINLANFFAFPILLGTGMDHGIHILHQNKKLKSANSAMQAILMSSFTTILGFGSLAFVRHPGLSSFGILLSVGSFFVLVSSTLVLPLFLKDETKA